MGIMGQWIAVVVLLLFLALVGLAMLAYGVVAF